MALTALSQTLTDYYLNSRPGFQNFLGYIAPTGVYDALVSDLAAGDYLIGARAIVTATGATTSGNRSMTIQRSVGPSATVSWPATSSVRITR